MPLRNSLHRRTHKERSQLAHRSKLGILEKHKDYVLRARDYRSKRDRLRTLKLKAETKNKDEFYFGMNGKKTEKGVEYRDRGGEGALPEDMVKVLKSQDEGYLRTVRKKGLKRIESIKTQLTAMVDLVPTPEDLDDLDDDVVDTLRSAGVLPPTKPISRKWKGKAIQSTPRHVVFVDNQEQAMNYTGPSGSESPAKSRDQWLSDDEDDNTEDWTEDMHEDDDDEDKYAPQRAQKQELKRQAAAKKHRLSLLQELSARLKRDTVLRHTLRELELQKRLMAPGARIKIRGPERVEQDDEGENEGSKKKRGEVKFAKQGDIDYTPRVYKWRSERKR
ncbi:U3 small nucleolar RNA-associated protein 11 [Rhizoctonia solani]|uniref:U3 small nucleolar RNA-associated protein 11 n=1 Tax=Rhizoctonia solani TaxID=456999 RepID=A0A8H7M1E5_9AGAM|nr:U3 small nucleolar RNA-associated protein 11 [Rhizoctonia solani]KAF8750805.1 U3 small nucleolar RNA-associated protein 11 [Rhizoctonia solani]